MAIEIKSRYAGKVLYTAENAQDVRAALEEARISGADLSGAYLRRADLSGADLSGADLRRAYLSGADGAAKGINRFAVDDLTILFDQPGRIRAYKLVTSEGKSPIHFATPALTYELGETVEVANANTDELKACGAGVNVGTLPWCIANWNEGYRILVVEFNRKDIAAIPVGTDGKFRVHRCKVVGEKDLAEIGLVVVDQAEPEKAAA